MAQKKVEFFKKSNIQINKTVTEQLTDEELLLNTQDILNSQIDAGDVIMDNEMPFKMLDTKLYWTAGEEANDLIVNINKDDLIIKQPLDGPNAEILNIEDIFTPVSNS
jgi:hypothetical protein